MDLYVKVMDYISNEPLNFSRTVVNGGLASYSGWAWGQPVGPTYGLSYTNPTTGAVTYITHPNGTKKKFGEPIGVIPTAENINFTQDGHGFEVETDTINYNAYVLQGAIVGTTTAPANQPPQDGPIVNTASNSYTTTETFNDGTGQPTQVTTTPGGASMDPFPQYFWVDVGPAPAGGGGSTGGNGSPGGSGSGALSVAFDSTTAGFSNPETPILTGSISGASGNASVEIYNGDPSNGGQDLGAATLNGDGTWTFSANIGANDFAALTAVATDDTGSTASAMAPYELVTGITGAPYHAQEFDYSSDGSYGYTDYGRNGSPLVDAVDNGDGTHTIFALANKQVLQSIGNDVMTGAGVDQSFVFVPGFGSDEITDFVLSGRGHDTIDLTNTRYSSLAQVLHHTSMSHGSAVIQLNSQDSITIDGITKAQIKAHPNDFALA